MTPLHTFGRNGPGIQHLTLSALNRLKPSRTRCSGASLSAPRQSTSCPELLTLRRWQSTSRVAPPPPTAQQQHQRKAPAHKYPSIINVYSPGTTATVVQGTNRIIALVLFSAGIFWTAHIYYLPSPSPDPSIQESPSAVSNKALWMIGLPILSITPLVLTVFVSGSYVHSIRVHLPTYARRNRDALLRFASEPSPTTQLDIAYMAFRPWPKWRTVYYEDLRRARGKLSVNLLHMPLKDVERVGELPLSARLFARQQGQYYVKTDGSVGQGKGNMGAVPDVWRRLWDSIPFEGEGGKAGVAQPSR
ncbi:hypothetical protein K431DRAFT_310515 [Polychaeton citri CBS 116435]|uniref:Uncharacterized protein n=1 Tax=Polychaeton citri CBS 116435 TaxID=1314669 RepID=A0A9P4QF68_9PEZI|nr:hypothetical protein K431DRAFT_310515 [Polychaeton citri CBS 116435]